MSRATGSSIRTERSFTDGASLPNGQSLARGTGLGLRRWRLKGGLTLALASCLTVPKPGHRSVVVMGAAEDLSASSYSQDDCSAIAGLAESFVAQPEPVQLVALGSGDKPRGFEPIGLLPWTTFERTAALGARPDEMRRARERWVRDVEASCRAAVQEHGGRTSSPLFRMLQSLREALIAKCADLSRTRVVCREKHVLILSDLVLASLLYILGARSFGRRLLVLVFIVAVLYSFVQAIRGASSSTVAPKDGHGHPGSDREVRP